MKLDSWKRPVEEEIEVKPELQMELDFTSECPDTARELGIRWEPRIATPEEVAEWHETEGKWWGDRALHFVALASVLQFCSIGFMLLSFYLLDGVF